MGWELVLGNSNIIRSTIWSQMDDQETIELEMAQIYTDGYWELEHGAT